jgi:hypothetical protein
MAAVFHVANRVGLGSGERRLNQMAIGTVHVKGAPGKGVEK